MITCRRLKSWSSMHKAISTIAVTAVCFAAGCSESELALKKAVSATQPPVEVSLTPFLIFDGYYVNVRNTSGSTSMSSVTL